MGMYRTVYIYIDVFMNYDYTAHSISPLATILHTISYFRKHCTERLIDAEMNDYRVFNIII